MTIRRHPPNARCCRFGVRSSIWSALAGSALRHWPVAGPRPSRRQPGLTDCRSCDDVHERTTVGSRHYVALKLQLVGNREAPKGECEMKIGRPDH